MAKGGKQRNTSKKRRLFRELMSGVRAMRHHSEGRLALRTRHVKPRSFDVVNLRRRAAQRRALARRWGQRWSGVRPVFLAILGSIVGPISTSSWNAYLDHKRHAPFIFAIM